MSSDAPVAKLFIASTEVRCPHCNELIRCPGDGGFEWPQEILILRSRRGLELTCPNPACKQTFRLPAFIHPRNYTI